MAEKKKPNIGSKRAVALRYEETGGAPVIVASGLGYMAERIVEMAHDSNVPVYEDNSLATLLSQLDLGSEIPEEVYQAVVDIYVYFLNYVPGQKSNIMKQYDDSENDREDDSEHGESL